jgi:uncharacterized protein YjbI with pentapeptide repeats
MEKWIINESFDSVKNKWNNLYYSNDWWDWKLQNINFLFNDLYIKWYMNFSLSNSIIESKYISFNIKGDNIIDWFFDIDNVLFNNNIKIFAIGIWNYYFSKCEFNEIKNIALGRNEIIFKDCTFNKDIIFKDCTFNKDVIFKNCIFQKDLIFENCTFKWKLGIKNCNWKIEIRHPKNLKNIKIYNDWENKDKELEIKINNIKFDKEWDYFFSWSSLKKLTLKSCVILSDYFKMTHLDDIQLNFIDVNLWKTTFNWVEIKKLYLENATLNDCIFNWVEFPKNSRLEEENLSNKQLKDNYRQLKFIMDKNWNYTEANKFYDWEMSYYIFSWNWLKKLHNNILWFFQLIISQFWNNWFLSLLWIILFGFIFTRSDWYYLINDFSNNFPFIDIKLDNYNINSINAFFTNINPFDKSLFTKDWVTYWNFWQKIILVILYWHLLIALKRTTKR